MKLYNTLARNKETFTPIDGKTARIYSCGPTVYSYAHIGNMRSYIFMDILRRGLRHGGFGLSHCMNITDVGHLVSDADEGEDKMAKAAAEQQMTPLMIAEKYSSVFFNDLKRLNIQTPEIIAKATEHIPEMLDFVTGLCDAGYGYETNDGIYYDISKFPSYGRLSRVNLEMQMAGARVEVNDEKRNPIDFALWKKAPKEHLMQWESPWGMGYPGWHIECSAMARKYLGDTFDIHTGGVDHIPIHHENEIAQSEALIGKPAVNVWMHGEFLLVDGGKMSKSLGTTYTVDTLVEKGFDPLAFRYFCLNAHYRSKLNFTWDALTGAQTALDNLYSALQAHKNSAEKTDAGIIAEYTGEFDAAVNDDLNIPNALGVLWKAVRAHKPSRDIYEMAVKMDEVFGLGFADYKPKEITENEIPPEVAALAQKRADARKAKDWKASDEARDALKALGWAAADTSEGQKLTRL